MNTKRSMPRQQGTFRHAAAAQLKAWREVAEKIQVAATEFTDDSHTELRPITIGHDYGTEVEVVSGLAGQEAIIINPPDSIVSGEEVRIVSQTSGGPARQGPPTRGVAEH